MSSSHVQIVHLKPPGNIHAEAFAEVAEGLAGGFRDLGIDTRLSVNAFDPGAVNLVLGWHFLPPDAAKVLPPKCILYNLEQLDDKNAAMRHRLADFGATCEIWDYSARNIRILHDAGFGHPVQHVPIGMTACLERISNSSDQDIDVLFYGSVNERRLVALQALDAAGLAVKSVFGVYGPARDELISRSKLVLNLHYYDSSIFELVRVSYLWANRKAVVAECHPGTELEPGLEEAACFVPYDGLVQACLNLVADADMRRQLESKGHEAMLKRPQSAYLRRVLAGEAEVGAT